MTNIKKTKENHNRNKSQFFQFLILLIGITMLFIREDWKYKDGKKREYLEEIKSQAEKKEELKEPWPLEGDAPKVLINQVGYEEGKAKKVYFLGTKDKNFQVISYETGEAVFTGAIEYKEKTGIGDFSQVKEPGSYFIWTKNMGSSFLFSVDRGIYEDEARKILDKIEKRQRKDTEVETKILADCLLAYFYFLEERETKESSILEKIKPGIDWLLTLQEEDGGVHQGIRDGIKRGVTPESTGRFAAVLAMFSQAYRDYDREYSKECERAALSAWNFLDSSYSFALLGEKVLKDKEERIWASAQLYNLTGRPIYRRLVEEAIDMGKEDYEKKEKVYSMLSYLTAKQPIDIEMCTNLMGRLLKEASSISRKWSEMNYETDKQDMERLYREPLLLMYAHYVAPSKQYETAMRAQLDYFLGCNKDSTSFLELEGMEGVLYFLLNYKM